MGVVYKARHLALKRVVALKMILSGGHAGEGERQRFRAEAEAVARLQHPNIVQVHEVGEHEGLPYAALEFVEGGTFAQRLKRGPVSPREAAEVIAPSQGQCTWLTAATSTTATSSPRTFCWTPRAPPR